MRNLHQHLQRVVDPDRPQRAFWGTDSTRLRCSYREAVTFFSEEWHFLSDTATEWIMGCGIAESPDWQLPTSCGAANLWHRIYDPPWPNAA